MFKDRLRLKYRRRHIRRRIVGKLGIQLMGRNEPKTTPRPDEVIEIAF